MKKFLFIFLIALLSCACLSCNSKKGGGNDTNSPYTNGAEAEHYIIFPTTVYITVILIILMGKIRKKIVTSCLFFREYVKKSL